MPKIMERGMEMTEVSTIRPAQMRERRDIEWLVNWALEKQGLGRSSDGGSSGGLGVKVDSSFYSNDGKWVSEDAIIIHDQLMMMVKDKRSSAAASLVLHYGRTGRQPDWGRDGSGKWELVRRNNGEGRAIRRYANQRRDAAEVLGFEWEWVGHTVDDLDRMMLEWIAWHAALCDLAEAVNPKLKAYVATPPRVSAAPWDEPERLIHRPDGSTAVA